MRKVALFVVLAALAVFVAGVSPAAEEEVSGCDATTGVGVASAAEARCSFQVLCPQLVCAYLVTLDVSGTGLVSGAMTAEPFLEDDFAFFGTGDPSNPEPVTCGPALFNCSFATTEEDQTLLIVASGDGQGSAAARITCSAGGLAAIETVQCSVTSPN